MNINFEDNFAQRRASQNVAYDPDSLLTGAEVEAGLDYENSTRVPVDRNTFSSDIDLAYHADAIAGELDTTKVLTFLPRTLKPGHALNTSEVAADGRWNYFGEGE
jgi:hypothetical protein